VIIECPVVERLITAVNAHDLDALTATFADVRPGGPDMRGVIIIKVRADKTVQSRFSNTSDLRVVVFTQP
jgi:hypothetical protein